VTVATTNITDCYLITPKVFRDERGTFFESYNERAFMATPGLSVSFVQDNHSISNTGVLRGLHFQSGKYAQAKLVRVVRGEVLDVVVDIRKNSPTFGAHFKVRLSGQNHRMLFIPKGLAHGFLSLTDDTVFIYKCDAYYNKEAEAGIIYSDPDLNIDWEYPTEKLILSKKDRELPPLKDLAI